MTKGTEPNECHGQRVDSAGKPVRAPTLGADDGKTGRGERSAAGNDVKQQNALDHVSRLP